LLEFLNNTYKTPEEIERDFDLPVLGSIRDMGRSKDNSNGVYVSKHPRSPIAESFRLLRANLELLSADNPLKTILITSCDKGVGKSTMATNLASIMAQSNRETILLDADLHTSNVHKLMGLPNDIGLSDVLLHEVDISETLRFYNGAKAGVITGGAPPLNPSELLGSIKMDRILARLTEVCDVVIIDAPPLFVSDALVLSAKADGVLLVVRLGYTRKKHVKSMLDQLDRAGANVIGVVLNGVAADTGLEYYGDYFQSSKIGVGSDGRLPAARNYWSGVVKKLGFATAANMNGKALSKEVRESYPAQVKGSNGSAPEPIERTGEFCPNEGCPDYGKLQSEIQKNIIKKGKSNKGGQRYLCKTCGKSYTETAATISASAYPNTKYWKPWP
jgi:capsular exopolysaccharide synthesis family protein